MTQTRAHRRMRRLFAPAAVAAAALLLAGCSGGVAGNAGNDSGDTIKLGLLGPLSGTEAAFGDYLKFAGQLAVNEINDAGGVNGKKLELLVEDAACDATTAVAGAQKLVTAGIVASVGGYCSGATLPTVPIFKDAKIPMVVSAANSNELLGQGVFLVNGTGAQQAEATVKWVKKSNPNTVVLVDDNGAYATDLADSIEKAADGLNIKRIHVNPDEKDFSASVNSILGNNPDYVVWTAYYQAGGLLINQLRAAGYDKPILVGDGSVDAQLSKIAGAAAMKNVYGTFTRTPDMLENGQQWIDDYKKVSDGAAPGPYSIQEYEAVKVIAKAMEDAKSTDGDKVNEALKNLKDFPVLTGNVTFNEDGSREGGGFVIVAPSGDSGQFALEDDLQG